MFKDRTTSWDKCGERGSEGSIRKDEGERMKDEIMPMDVIRDLCDSVRFGSSEKSLITERA
jgi:hypothetical protein